MNGKQEQELNEISKKLIFYMNDNPNQKKKGVYDIYNDWTSSEDVHIEYKETLQWCFLYIKTHVNTHSLTKDSSREILKTILSMSMEGRT